MNGFLIYSDPLMAILPKDYPLNGRTAFPVTEFSKHPFIISAEGVDYDVHQALEDAHITPVIPFSSKDDHVIVSMVANKLGLSILPDLVIKGVEQQITAIPLEPFYTRELGIAVSSKRRFRLPRFGLSLKFKIRLKRCVKQPNKKQGQTVCKSSAPASIIILYFYFCLFTLIFFLIRYVCIRMAVPSSGYSLGSRVPIPAIP